MANQTQTQCDPVNDLNDSLWQSTFGEAVLRLEQPVLAPLVRRFHGDSVIWIGDHAGSAQALQRCMVRCPIYLSQQGRGPLQNMPSLTARLDALPFRSNAVDGVVLHHALERAADPRVALREVARILAPGGRALIIGFNPMSLLGLRRLYARAFSDALSRQRMVNPIRLYDWLTLLGLELQGRPQYCGFGLPLARRIQRLKPLQRLQQPGIVPFAEVLMVDVVKQAAATRPPWRLTKAPARLAPVAYPRVASWQRSEP